MSGAFSCISWSSFTEHSWFINSISVEWVIESVLSVCEASRHFQQKYSNRTFPTVKQKLDPQGSTKALLQCSPSRADPHAAVWTRFSSQTQLLSVQNLIGRFAIFILLELSESRRAARGSSRAWMWRGCRFNWTWIYWVTDTGSGSSVPINKPFLFSCETD